MRLAALTFIGAIGLAMSANAAPVMPAAPAKAEETGIVKIWGPCGWGFHPTPWGYCVPNRYGYYRPYRHWGGYYGGGYHRYWHNHRWHGY
jgi:hypothetical protein